MFHQLIVLGRIGREPERHTDSSPVTFSVATDVKVKGEKVTLWVRVNAWQGRGDFIEQYGRKGARVQVVGTLVVDPATGGPRVWDSGNGPRASYEINANEITLLDWPDRDEEAQPRFNPASATYIPAASEDEIPF